MYSDNKLEMKELFNCLHRMSITDYRVTSMPDIYKMHRGEYIHTYIHACDALVHVQTECNNILVQYT